MNYKHSLAALCAILALVVTSGATPIQQPAKVSAGLKVRHSQTVRAVNSTKAGDRHPRIRKAIIVLTRAKTLLQRADRDLGGHRARAIAHVEEALADCRAALAAHKK